MSGRVRKIPVTGVQRYPFVVNETPYCVWDTDIPGRDLEFLKMIDPAYFDHIAISMGKLLPIDQANRESREQAEIKAEEEAKYAEEEVSEDAKEQAKNEARYAAVTLRTAYSHGLETLFALIGASVQANQSIAGWMLKYKITELEELVRKIHAGRPIIKRIALDRLTWETLAETFTPIGTGDADKDQRMRQHFGRLWRRLASDFLAKETGDEYNSIKHGLRVSMHCFYLAMGLEGKPGVAAPPENMRLMGSSEFGNTYFTTEKLHDGRNFRILQKSHNWNPWKFVYALQLISMSINNVVTTLKLQHGVPGSEALCKFPDNEELFDLPWKQDRTGITSMSWNPILTEGMIIPMTKDEISASYQTDQDRQTNQKDQGNTT